MLMLEYAIKNYYTFFDETLQSSTLVVLMITLLICLLGISQTQANYAKGNVLEFQNAWTERNIIVLEGKKYEVLFTEVK